MHKHRLIRSLLREPVDRTPVWLMRQAGRYLPEYRKIRQEAKDFLTLCKTPELACQVSLQPIHRYHLDAAIIFSDILTLPEAMGLDLFFEENQGPMFKNPVHSELQIKQLHVPDPEIELKYVMDLIRMLKQELSGKLPMIGFSGSPWTMATYMVEGKSPKNFNVIKRMMYQDPRLLHELLGKLADATIQYLNAQIAAGVEAVMLFDTWGGVLSSDHYQTFSLKYMKKIIQGVTRKVGTSKIPIILFTKNSGQYLSEIKHSGADAVGIDWTVNMSLARSTLGETCAIQGNLEPSVLYAEELAIKNAVSQVLEQYGIGTGHIFNLGHGMHPDVDPEKVTIMLEYLHQMSPQYHIV